MAGNSRRRGARRNPGSKKGATAGSGGKGRDRLAGRGPTPPADQRPGHPAQRRAAAKNKRTGPRRKDTDIEIVAGRNPVVEALRAQIPATALYVVPDTTDDRVAEAIKRAADRGVPILETSRTELDRLSAGATHQGIGLQVPPFSYAHPDDLANGTLLVAVDGVTDPRNLGAVVRSAAAFGADGVVVPERRASGITAAAWRTSAGAAARLPIARATNLVRALKSYQSAGLLVVGLDADGDTSLDDFAGAADPLCLVVGSEGRGLSRLVGESCDLRISIPMTPRAGWTTESLNASVAAAVVLADIARVRRKG